MRPSLPSEPNQQTMVDMQSLPLHDIITTEATTNVGPPLLQTVQHEQYEQVDETMNDIIKNEDN